MGQPLKVLVVSQAFPYPPYDGDLLPIFHFLRCLAPRVRYTLLTLRPAEDWRWEEGRAVLEGWGIDVRAVGVRPQKTLGQALICLRHGRPWYNRFFVPELARLAEAALAEGGWDVIHAEGIMSAQHLPRRLGGVGSVLIARDCLSLNHWRAWRVGRRPWDLFQWAKIRWMEHSLYRRFGRVLAISPTDRDEMARIAPGIETAILPNGVDLAQFAPAPELEEEGVVAFSGAMDYPPNVDAALWFAREVWPRVHARRGGARFLIVGRDPAPEVRALAEADPTITVTGRVASIQAWLARASVIVSPLRHGTGMKNKVLEGAALGKAMVVSPVSLEDIDLAPGRDLLLAGSPEEFADKTAALLDNAPERRRLGASARSVVQQHYAWEAMAERLWESYERVKGLGSRV